MALNKKNRLKKKRDLESVFKKGKAVKGSFLSIKYKKTEIGIPRFGFIVSTKVSKKAVERNRIKRILSETAWKAVDNLNSWDIVIFSVKNIISATKTEIVNDLIAVLNKIK